MTATGHQLSGATTWDEARVTSRRLTGVRDTFLLQSRRSSRYAVGRYWRGRAPGFPCEQRWLITKIRLRGEAVKVWGVQSPECDAVRPTSGAIPTREAARPVP